MRRHCLLLLSTIFCISVQGQQVLDLKTCRELALENNKQLKINSENIKKTEAQKKEAFTQYLPDISLTAAYFYNQKNISLLDENKFLPVGTFSPEGGFNLTNEYAVIPKSQFELDIHNIFLGTVSLVQPIFMGGKIKAYNEISDYAVQLAESMNKSGVQDIIVQVDHIYWQSVSLSNKLKLSDKLVELLNQMNRDVELLIHEGVATKADGLSVKVKLNEAEMAEMQISNGLQLSKMVLCQLCGLSLDNPITLTDEYSDEIKVDKSVILVDINKAFEEREEIRSLTLASKIYKKKEDIVKAEMMPNIALMGNYIVSNPSSFNGFQNKFDGMFNVGVMLNMPIFHWGEKKHKLNAAKAETRIKQLEIDEVKEKIELQINRDAFKLSESEKKLVVAEKNKENAEENLRYANLGFKEGVIPATNLMEAQTAWYKAHTDLIDAQIDIQLNRVQLEKATGSLEVKID